MSWRTSIFSRTGFAALLALVIGLPAHAVDCDDPVSLGERPRLGDYDESRDFLAAAMDYRKQEARYQEQLHKCPHLAGGPSKEPPAEPEDLDEAIERGRNLPEFDYARHPRWYDRTTSRTFGLPSLPQGRMDDRLVPAPIHILDKDRVNLEALDTLVALRGPAVDEVLDGRQNEDLYLRLLHDRLPEDERKAAKASEQRPYTHIAQYRNPAGTWLTFYYLGDDLVLTAGFVAGCLAYQC